MASGRWSLGQNGHQALVHHPSHSGNSGCPILAILVILAPHSGHSGSILVTFRSIVEGYIPLQLGSFHPNALLPLPSDPVCLCTPFVGSWLSSWHHSIALPFGFLLVPLEVMQQQRVRPQGINILTHPPCPSCSCMDRLVDGFLQQLALQKRQPWPSCGPRMQRRRLKLAEQLVSGVLGVDVKLWWDNLTGH